MNDEKWDQGFKEKVRSTKGTAPDEITDVVQETLRKLPRDRQTSAKSVSSKLFQAAMAFIILFGSLFGAAYLSPAFANTLQSVPIVGSVFKTFGDAGLRGAQESGLEIGVNEEIKVEESSFSITEAVYDGRRLVIGYQINNHIPSEQLHYHIKEVIIQGKKYAGFNISQANDEQGYMGIFKADIDDVEMDQNTLDVSIVVHNYWREGQPKNHVNPDHYGTQSNKEEEGVVKLNIEVLVLEATSFIVEQSKSYEDWTINVEQIMLTPITTALSIETTYPESFEDEKWMDYYLFNEEGLMLESVGESGRYQSSMDSVTSSTMWSYYEPLFDELPTYLVLKPYVEAKYPRSRKEIKKDWTGHLPFQISDEHSGSITILDAQFLEAQTIVQYQVESILPYSLSYFKFIDMNGEEYRPIQSPSRISSTKYQFTGIFPKMDAHKIKEISFFGLQEGQFMEALALKIPIQQSSVEQKN